jgi:predicted membrane protein
MCTHNAAVPHMLWMYPVFQILILSICIGHIYGTVNFSNSTEWLQYIYTPAISSQDISTTAHRN